MKSLPQRRGLDTGSCLRNIESFITTSAVLIKYGLGKYILNVDIRQLAEYLFLTKDIPAWEMRLGLNLNSKPKLTSKKVSPTRTVRCLLQAYQVQQDMVLVGLQGQNLLSKGNLYTLKKGKNNTEMLKTKSTIRAVEKFIRHLVGLNKSSCCPGRKYFLCKLFWLLVEIQS